MALPRRLARLPSRPSPWGECTLLAAGWRARLLGLAGLEPPADPMVLELPRCRSVHTFGMRFALDLVWLDGSGAVIRLDRSVPPRRLRSCRRARTVLEIPAAIGSPSRPLSTVKSLLTGR